MVSLKCKMCLKKYHSLYSYRFNKLSKSAFLNWTLIIGAIGLLIGSLAFSFVSNLASYYNYPGGDAIRFFNRAYCKLYRIIKPSLELDLVNEIKINPNLPKPYIHSDVYTTMTGFTRFMHENDS